MQEAADIYEARAAIESLIVRRFVERTGEDHIRRLADTLTPLRAAIDAGRPVGELLARKDQFYDVLLDGADSAVLSTLLSSLQARVSLLRATSLTHEGRPAEMLAELGGWSTRSARGTPTRRPGCAPSMSATPGTPGWPNSPGRSRRCRPEEPIRPAAEPPPFRA